MHFYAHHIGDYIAHTRHLSPLEDIAYRRMLEFCYLTERPLSDNLSTIARQIGMREHEKEIQLVLEEFFILGADGWINDRVEREIEKYRANIDAGKRGAAKRWSSPPNGLPIATPLASPMPPHADPNTNHEPLTINHKPLTKKRNTEYNAPPDGVAVDVWHDFLKLRKAKRAPIGKTVVESIWREANKAGITLEDALQMCVERGWSSFRSDWLKPSHLVVAKGQPLSFAEQDRRAGIRRWEQMTNERHPDNPDYLDDGDSVLDVVDQALARLSA